ncbi:MAG: hypothetical protein ACU0A8_07505 [Limimaricola soesokkakensis]|uniref:hypothetical protein n=1 Tax=Limimaricola soesokkakensis TaxID=1343159 RepID=UPI004058F270
MTKLDNNAHTIFCASDAGGLTEAAQDTIVALRRHGFNEHATKISRSMGRFMAGRSMVKVATLRQWSALLDEAFDLLCDSPIEDPCIADDTADVAQSYVIRELRALEAGAESTAAA